MSVWSAIETAPMAAAALGWHQRLGPDFGAAAALCLRETRETAERVPCPRGCGCGHRVVRRSAECGMRSAESGVGGAESGVGSAVLIGVCDCEEAGCEDLPLTERDVAVLEVDLAKLGRAVARALEIPGRDAPSGLARARQIGAFGPAGIPVVLAVQAGGLGDLLARLVSRLKSRFVLLVPTGRFVTVECQELLASVGARHFDLESNFEIMASGRLAARKKGGELFAGLLPERPVELDDAELRKIYARVLLSAKDEKGAREAPIKDVFDLYCLKGFSAQEVALKLGCSKATVMNRLAALKELAGVPAQELRACKPFFEQVEKELTDPRARRVRRMDAMYGQEAEEGDE